MLTIWMKYRKIHWESMYNYYTQMCDEYRDKFLECIINHDESNEDYLAMKCIEYSTKRQKAYDKIRAMKYY